MKIVRVINELRLGGVQLRLSRVARALAARGHEVVVVCTEAEGPNAAFVREGGVRVETVPVSHWDDRASIRRLAAFLRRERPDVVHSHLFRQNAPATVAARLARVPKVFAQVHLVGTYQRSSWKWTDRVLSRFRTATIAVSEAVARDIRASLAPFAPPRLVVLVNGVELDRFAGQDRAEAAAAVRAEFGFAAGDLVFLNAARLEPEKNQRQLLDAFAKARVRAPNARLLIAGGGDLRGELEARARDLSLDGAVVFAGERRDIPRLMAGSDVFVLPSRQEGFSNAILEAMASGLPLLVSDVGGAREACKEGRNGIVVPAMDERALVDAIARLAADAPARASMSDANRCDVLEFTQERMIDRTVQLYEGAGRR